ncbi:MAG: MerR family transcriptional regulator [Pseudomonadota bacterium]
MPVASATEKSAQAFRTISEVSDALGVPQHVLRFWETRFSQLRPLKRGGNRRYYRPEDIDLLRTISHLHYTDGYTIKGIQKLLRDKGAKALVTEFLEREGQGPFAEPGDGAAVAPETASEANPPAPPTAQDDPTPCDPKQELAAVIAELRALRDLLAKGHEER